MTKETFTVSILAPLQTNFGTRAASFLREINICGSLILFVFSLVEFQLKNITETCFELVGLAGNTYNSVSLGVVPSLKEVCARVDDV